MLLADRILQCLGGTLTLATILASVGCGVAAKTDSGLDQLTEQGFQCVEYTPEQIAQKLTGMPDGFLRLNTWPAPLLERVQNALAGIPKPYLDFLYAVRKQNGFDISRTQLETGANGSVIGVTTIANLPLKIQISTQSFAPDFAVQHEVGHAIDAGISLQNNTYDFQIEKLFKQEGQNPNIRGYAASQSGEFFAESFNNFYCSKPANAFLQSQLPSTYAFLKQSLEKPVFESDAEVDPSTLSRDLYLALVDTNAAKDPVPSVISLPDSLSSAAICKGEFAACVANPRADIKFSAFDLKIAGRKIFKSATGLVLNTGGAGNPLTILGFDASGALKAARALALTDVSP